MEPGHAVAGRGDVVALEGRHRNGRYRQAAQLAGKGQVILFDFFKAGLGIVHHVHLVDGQHHLADAHQVHQVAVAPGLGQHALACVHQHHGHVCGGRTGHHIAGVLLVPRCVGHDELALVGREESIGHVNGDALLALGGQAVHQQGKVNLLALGAHAFAVGFQSLQLVFKNHFAVVKQAPDQRAFSVVHAAAGDKAQQALVLVLVQIGLNVLANQVAGVCHLKVPLLLLLFHGRGTVVVNHPALALRRGGQQHFLDDLRQRVGC